MASKRQRIVTAIVARMKLINGTGDYVTNIANRAQDSQTGWQEEELPAISVFDLTANATPASIGAGIPRPGILHDMQVMIRGFVKSGSDSSDVRQLLADIQTAIRQDFTWTDGTGPTVMQTRQISDEVTRTDSFEIDGCVQTIEVQFITQKFNAVT